jgi:5-methylcytosine-specific restriction endonuclease McrA
MKKCLECDIELVGKDKKFFCSRSHANAYNMRGKPSHNYKHGIASYRQEALKEHSYKCTICGYDIVEVLEVHHKDSNRRNNISSNLDVLCPTHHKEYQLGIRKYPK